MQHLAHLRTSLLMLGQMYLDVMRCCVARNCCGIQGRGTPVESNVGSEVGNGSGCNLIEDVDDCLQ